MRDESATEEPDGARLGRIGILGGCFDPVHLGHIAAAEDAAEALRLERVLLVPAGSPPHKDEGTAAPAADRLAMARLAVEDLSTLDVSDIEVRRPGTSYTVDTLRELTDRLGEGCRLYLLLGTDAARILPIWHEVSEVFHLAEPAVLERPGDESVDWDGLGRSLPDDLVARLRSSVLRLPNGRAVASADIRRRIAAGEEAMSLAGSHLAASVARYIEEHGLYGPVGD